MTEEEQIAADMINSIAMTRKKLNKLIKQGIDSHVIKISQELDELINNYIIMSSKT